MKSKDSIEQRKYSEFKSVNFIYRYRYFKSEAFLINKLL